MIDYEFPLTKESTSNANQTVNIPHELEAVGHYLSQWT